MVIKKKLATKQELFLEIIKVLNALIVNPLTRKELLVFSYILYYNDKYKEIKDDTIRFELITSTNVKAKLKKEFGMSTMELETYITKLKKKGVMTKEGIAKEFLLYPEDNYAIKFEFVLNNFTAQVLNTPTPQPIAQPTQDEYTYPEPEEKEDYYTGDIFNRTDDIDPSTLPQVTL